MRVLMLDGGDRTPYLSWLMARLARQGVEVHYAGDARWKDFAALEADGVRCHAVTVRHKLDFPTRWRIRRLLDGHGIEILHTITGRDAYVGLKARAGRRNIRTIVRRGAYAAISRFDPADRVVYGPRGADRFIVVSRDLARHMQARGLAPERIRQVYTGIWSPELEASRVDLRAEFGLGEETFLLALIGKLRPVKGFDYLLAALARLHERRLPFHLFLAGEGYERARPRMRAHGLENSITLLGFRNDVLSITASVDAVVLPSRIDALPRAAIEATVLGTPVVATSVGGIPEILDEGRGGVLVDPEAPESMAAALERAIREPEELRALADAVRPRNRDLFGIDRCADRHLELYREALA